MLGILLSLLLLSSSVLPRPASQEEALPAPSPQGSSSDNERRTITCPGTAESVLFVCELSICQVSCQDGTEVTTNQSFPYFKIISAHGGLPGERPKCFLQ